MDVLVPSSGDGTTIDGALSAPGVAGVAVVVGVDELGGSVGEAVLGVAVVTAATFGWLWPK